MMNKNTLQYMVGGLLYMPAMQDNIAEKIQGEKIPSLTSIALCLEDAIQKRRAQLDTFGGILGTILNR